MSLLSVPIICIPSLRSSRRDTLHVAQLPLVAPFHPWSSHPHCGETVKLNGDETGFDTDCFPVDQTTVEIYQLRIRHACQLKYHQFVRLE